MRDYGEHTRVNDSMAIKPHTKPDKRCEGCTPPAVDCLDPLSCDRSYDPACEWGEGPQPQMQNLERCQRCGNVRPLHHSNPKGWDEVDGVKLPSVEPWAEPWRYPLDMSEFRAVLMPRGDTLEEPMAQYTRPY